MLAYLVDGQGLIVARNKEIRIRPLDKNLVAEEKTKWQVINLLVPVFLLIAYGIARAYWRRQKYSRFT
jgi:ABC-2 type transport system permease protein